MTTIRELLNERRWHQGDLAALELVIRHRGAPRDERVVPGAAILDIGPRGVTISEDIAAGDGGDVWIPYHRVLAVRAPGATLWSKPAPVED